VSLARKHRAKIVLRIDDLDQQRTRNEYLQDIFDTLDFLEIPYDEGPRNVSDLKNQYSQRCRMPYYQALLEDLANADQLFACDCSRKKIQKNHPKGWYNGHCLHRNLSLTGADRAWRLKTRPDIVYPLIDYPGVRRNCQIPDAMAYFVVRKKDRDPAYQLASLVDDRLFGIDLIVRGEDLWDSSCAQLYLSSLLPDQPLAGATFFHHPLLKEGNQKLSKSEGALAIRTMRQRGMKKTELYRLAAKHTGVARPVQSLEEFVPAYLDLLEPLSPTHQNPE
jgi:glutamyl-tRNA synthetase